MSDLQWALVGLGIVVIIAVYMYTRMTRPSSYDYLDNIPPEEDEPVPPPAAWDDDNDLDWLSRPNTDDVEDPFRFEPEAEAEAKSEPEARPKPEAKPEPEPDAESGPVREDREPMRAPQPESPVEREPSLARVRPGREQPVAPQPPVERVAPEMPEAFDVRMPDPPSEGQKLVVLHVAAPQGQRFGGDAVHGALLDCDLRFGARLVYHRIKEVDGTPESVFSVANMVKPGHLDPMERDRLRTPGLSLFMVLPGPEDPVPAYRDLERTAEHLATQLGGEVLDERRQLLTRQMSQFLQEEMSDLERRQLAGRSSER